MFFHIRIDISEKRLYSVYVALAKVLRGIRCRYFSLAEAFIKIIFLGVKMKKIADFFAGLPWIVLLVLVIFFDGLVGGCIRIGNGKSTASKVVGWILFVIFILNVLSIALTMPAILAWVLRVLYFVCWIADVVTVAVSKKITLFM